MNSQGIGEHIADSMDEPQRHHGTRRPAAAPNTCRPQKEHLTKPYQRPSQQPVDQDVLDLTARTVARRMAATAPAVDYLDAGISQLRRDGESLELLMLEMCAVGASARCWIQVRDDHIVTLRTTSPVVRIVALDPSEP